MPYGFKSSLASQNILVRLGFLPAPLTPDLLSAIINELSSIKPLSSSG